MASLMFSSASDRVFPSEIHPGKLGTSATNTPSSSGSMMTRYFMEKRGIYLPCGRRRHDFAAIPARRGDGGDDLVLHQFLRHILWRHRGRDGFAGLAGELLAEFRYEALHRPGARFAKGAD